MSLPPRQTRHRLLAFILLLSAWSLIWAVASAQTFPPLVGVVSDNTGNVNASQVNDAARSLQALNVKPLAVFSSSRAGATSIADFGHQAAANYGLLNNGVVDPNLFEIAVTTTPRELTVIWGDALNPIMNDPPTGQGIGTKIRTQFVQPNLAAGDYTKAFVAGFQQAAKEIDLYRNPPTATPVPTAAPPNVTNVDTSGIGNALLWIAGIVVLGIALLILIPIVYRSYRRNQEAAGRRAALLEQLAQARKVAADMITALDFPVDPREQIQYRFLALALESERPDQLATLTAQYHDMYNRVADALSRFNDLNNATPATEPDISNAIAGYQYVQQEIKDAAAFLAHFADMSKEVETQAAAAPGEVDQAKKALAAATSSIERLAAASPDLYHPKPDLALKPAAKALAAAQQALSSPPRSLHAYDSASTAVAQANTISQAVTNLTQAYNSLTALRTKISDLRAKGYKLPHADESLAPILSSLSTAAKELETADPARFAAALKKATDSTTQLAATIDSTPALHASNGKALADLQSAGEQVKAYIDQGAKAFDQVDEYAESSWHDIRGNGTEAQKAADHAHDLWQQASVLNALSPDSPQDFEQARALITEANTALDQARKLIAAIIDRLKNIQESERTAQAEIASASHDIQAGQDFVSKYDRDITPHPADLLKAAASDLKDAQAEAAKPKPDWIAVVAKARNANDTADKALAEARSQHEAIEARRLKLTTLLQQAQASASRAANFASVHRSDLSPDVLHAIDDATRRSQEGSSMSTGLETGKLEDAALSDAYDKVIAALTLSQGKADQAYSDAFAQFNAMENLRANLRTALQQALDRIKEAAEYISYHSQNISDSPVRLLQQAQDAMPTLQDSADAQTIQSYIAAATQAGDLASQAYNDARSQYDAYQEEQDRRNTQANVDAGANIALSILGALIASGGSGGRRRGGGWSGGWGGGSSWGSRGGGWGGGGSFGGGGGSSSGGWGGGGSSSGSFGGGGSSSGSWGGGGSSSGGW